MIIVYMWHTKLGLVSQAIQITIAFECALAVGTYGLQAKARQNCLQHAYSLGVSG